MNDCVYPIAYAVYHNNPSIRKVSTSGGVFTALAEYFICNFEGVVYGASFSEDFNVYHIRIDSVEGLGKLRGSKYPQSLMLDSYKRAKSDLDNDLMVLFVGTPCQIAGLKGFLGKDYDNLFCLDFVCHGVASDKVWRDYVKKLNSKGDISDIIFKYKYRGWKKWYFRVNYENGNFWQRRGYLTKFMHSYLSYANIRPSCYECKFKGIKHNSDFTISDCWGVAENDKSINDNNGLSALLIQNDRAREIFENISSILTYKKFDVDELMEGNWTTYFSVPKNEYRDVFFKYVSMTDGYKALKKYFSPGVVMWIKYYALKFLGYEK